MHVTELKMFQYLTKLHKNFTENQSPILLLEQRISYFTHAFVISINLYSFFYFIPLKCVFSGVMERKIVCSEPALYKCS